MEYICVADKLINEKQFLIIEAISLENGGGNENFPDKVRKLSGNIDVWFAISRHTEGSLDNWDDKRAERLKEIKEFILMQA